MKSNLVDFEKLLLGVATVVLVFVSAASAQTECRPTENTVQVGTVVAHPVFAGSSVSATSLSSNSVRVDFSADERAHQWEVCWKLGRFNPVPTCSGFTSSSAFAGNGQTSGQYTVTGLKSNRWYTFKVRGRFIKPNGSVQSFWHFVGKAEVKTPK